MSFRVHKLIFRHSLSGTQQEEVARVIESAPQMELEYEYDGQNCLHIAAIRGYTTIVKALMRRGVDIHVKTYLVSICLLILMILMFLVLRVVVWVVQRETALHWAATQGHASCLTLLLEAGADINSQDMDVSI